MSSMRNAAPRRSHRERAQPQARAKWGLLEKHKDYSLRAADYNQKKKRLNILSQKSKERNPDEFAFGMLSADKGRAGKHGRGDRVKNQLDHDVVEKLKGQDVGYLRALLGRNRRELERVKEEIGLDGVMKNGGGVAMKEETKLVFNDDGEPVRKRRRVDSEELEDLSFDEASGDDMTVHQSASNDAANPRTSILADETEMEVNEVSMALRRPDASDMEDLSDDSQDQNAKPKVKSKRQLRLEAEALARRTADKRRRKRAREARAHKLEILKSRQKSIMAAASELELQRAKMARTVGGINKNGVQFKIRERKR